jgi:tetratricopeptide (TPR) repeat protein
MSLLIAAVFWAPSFAAEPGTVDSATPQTDGTPTAVFGGDFLNAGTGVATPATSNTVFANPGESAVGTGLTLLGAGTLTLTESTVLASKVKVNPTTLPLGDPTKKEGLDAGTAEKNASAVASALARGALEGISSNVHPVAAPCKICTDPPGGTGPWGEDTVRIGGDGQVVFRDGAQGAGSWGPQETAAVTAQADRQAAAGNDDKASALIHAVFAKHPDDKILQSYVALEDRKATTLSDKSLKGRAEQLLAMMRGDSGAEIPPGAAIASSPELASALAFPNLGAASAGPRALTPAALAAMNALSAKDGGLKRSDPLVRDAMSRIAVRDLPAAEVLLNRRLEQNPSDENALLVRAVARQKMGRYEPSAHDAQSAISLAPWDVRPRRVLIDDEINLGHPDQALAEANQAMRDTPNSADLYAARADVYASMGNRAAELADRRQAAALDPLFEQFYQQALAGPAAAPISKRPHSMTVWLGAVGTALIFFSFVLFRKRGESSVRLAMREDDHALLQRGARPDAAPAGFKIVRTLGQGGMGVVYEAVDLGLQRTVALKKLRSEIADSPRERARFLKEARTVAALKHPNIVEIHAIHEDGEGLFLVFEKVSGETLHERLGRGALPPAEAVAYLRQIAKALDCAHSSGVVHQDLKPANVMVAGDVAKVMDFGIARRVQETMSTLSRIEVAGTPAYMAPEQERGGSVGPAADIFALGACSYELLTGRTPFPNGGMMMKAEKMYRPASEVNPSISAAADNAISRALEPDPAARWPSASSFVEALARSLS